MIDRDGFFVAIGKVVKAHGLKGGLKVFSYAESPDVFRTDGGIFMGIEGQGARRPVKIVSVNANSSPLIIQLDGIYDRTAAEALVGETLFVQKQALPPAAADEYYWFDLIGLEVISGEGQPLGNLSEIIQTGSNDVYVVKDSQKGRETLVPALKSVITEINLDRGYMRIQLPEGL